MTPIGGPDKGIRSGMTISDLVSPSQAAILSSDRSTVRMTYRYDRDKLPYPGRPANDESIRAHPMTSHGIDGGTSWSAVVWP